ncbi:MAG: L-ribulose-5-phosphate 3-epimerase [Clostridia bacterium]|nr:L-ribulose-5-phosphate 3-epimerase [Clostridia bacterium]
MKPLLTVYEKAMPGTLSWREKLTAAGAAGFDGVEISIDETEAKLARLDWSAAQRREWLALTRETGVVVQTMCLSGHRKFPLGSADPAVCARGMEIARKAIGFAFDTGIRIIQLAGYDVYYEPSTADTRARFGENLREVVRAAAERGVILAFETMETPFMNTVEKAMHYVREVDSPWLQVYPDVGNVCNGTPDPAADIAGGRGHIVAAHLKDTKPGVFRDLHYGEGAVDFPRLIRVLKEQGVGLYNAELWYDAAYKGGDWAGALREAHDFLRPLLEEQV